MQIDPAKRYQAILRTTKGDITIELLAGEAPMTVNNFVFLAREGFYDGVKFHRVIKPFMIQTGDPTGTGRGGPGYRFPDELPPKHPYEPGIVAMANAGPNTNGSQFFICSGPQAAGLNQYPNYTQFGRVVQGMDVVQALASVPVTASFGGERSKPLEDIRIESVSIIEEE
jgi:peptidylprolyl isomerase